MNNNFVIENGVLISCEGTEITKIPEGVHTIRANSIDCSYYIKELYLPNSLQIVEVEAFNGWHGLRKLVMPARFILPWDDNIRYRLGRDNVNTSAVFFSFFGRYISSDLEEIVVFGEEKDLDLQCFDFKAIQTRQNIVLRIENEVTSIKFGDQIRKNSYKQDITPKVYVNNYVENVQIDAPAKWDQKNIIFRAPKPNMTETTDYSVELTLAPRAAKFDNDIRWSCPIKINVSAVTYLYPVELGCYESDTHQGCKLLLLGNRIEDIPLEQLSRETYPSIIVWEDYDTVYNKLKAKGWTR